MIVIVMGVSGCGKTTIGRLLAERLGWPFYDGDDYHSPANVEKMSRGIPLADDDRADWLAALAALMRRCVADDQSAVLACSALKQNYRDKLRVDAGAVRFVYLKGSYDLILDRMAQRPGHYMKSDMLVSQFEALEEPDDALTVDIALPPEEITARIIRQLVEERMRNTGVAQDLDT